MQTYVDEFVFNGLQGLSGWMQPQPHFSLLPMSPFGHNPHFGNPHLPDSQTSVLTNVSFPYNVPHPVGSQDPFCSSHLASVPSPNPVRLSLCLPHHSSGDGVLSFCVYLSIFSIRLGAHEGKAHLRLTHSFTHRMYATCIIVG